jgi:gas vesicle protein
MFGFGKKKKREETGKKHSKIDKLIMGAIVGGAVGSVIGMSIAPKKGSDTRGILAQKGKDLLKKGQEMKAKYDNAEAGKSHSKPGLFGRAAASLFSRGKKVRKNISEEDMKKIPNEIE